MSTSVSSSRAALAQIAARIFGNHVADGSLRTGRKFLQKPLIGAKLAAYFPNDPQNWGDDDYLDDEVERRKEKLAYLRSKGITRPKKGEGKRSKK
eukprot:tig00000704_g3328.t1